MVLMPRRSDALRLMVTAGAFLALALFAACAPTEPAEGALLNAAGDTVYTDGTYLVSYSHTGTDGWQPFLQFRVRAGLITEACYGAIRADGLPVRNDEDYVERFRLETGVDLPDFLDRLEAELSARQELPLEIPTTRLDERVTWSSSFAVLADAALHLARIGDAGTAVIPAAGPYVGHDQPDELGWEARMVVIFGEVGVVAASFQERRVEADGTASVKADDAAFTEAYERVLDLTPAGVAAELSGQFVQVGAPETGGGISLDGISGATGTTNRFQVLADQVLATRISVPLPNKLCTR